jgi:hypothetical protein
MSGRSKPTHKQQYDENDQDDTDDTDAAVTETVAVAAEAATKATKQEDDKDNDEYKSERHGLSPLVEPNEYCVSWYSDCKALIFIFSLTSVGGAAGKMPHYFFSIEMPRSPMLISTPVVFCRSW